MFLVAYFYASILCLSFCRCRAEFNELNIHNEQTYPTPYAHSPLLPILLESVARQKNSPDTCDCFGFEYDYIIVGAGSAGSVLAARLSENPLVTVLLLEAGGQPPYLSDVPVTARNFIQSAIDWNYTTVPQKHTGAGLVNRQIPWPKGKSLGGSSVWNVLFYIRGNKENYNDWARDGATGWSYEEVFPYFLKAEGNQNADFLLNGYHNFSGPLSVERQAYYSLLSSAVQSAGSQAGYPFVDSNGAQQLGFDDFQLTLRNQQRCSAAKAYLVPAENRPNLNIVTHAHVNKILIVNGRAVGVEFWFQDRLYTVNSKIEVISSAGTVNSAKLLMLSGIGPEQHLKEHGIPVVANLPVGSNFQDHCAAIIGFTLSGSIPLFSKSIVDPENIVDYINNRQGPLASAGGIIGLAFLKDEPETFVDKPDYQLYFLSSGFASDPSEKKHFGLTDEVYNEVYAKYSNKSTFACAAQIVHPKSRGSVKLRSSDPWDAPLIDPNYLENDEDVRDIISGMKKCLEIGYSQPLQNLGSRVFDTVFPGCEAFVGQLDSYLLCQARSFVQTLSHEVGTCKMGSLSDPSTVLDPRLRVKGIKGLRVVDASVIPTIVAGNMNAPVIMIAEKAADMIKFDNNFKVL